MKNPKPIDGGFSELDNELDRLFEADRDAYQRRLRQLASHLDMCVRDEVAERLGELALAEDLALLLKMSEDHDWVVRCSAVSSLAEYAVERAYSRIIELLRDRSVQVRRWSIVAAVDSGMDRERKLDLLRSMAGEKNYYIRLTLYVQLSRLGDASARARFERLAKSEGNSMYHRQARWAIDEMRSEMDRPIPDFRKGWRADLARDLEG